jgi:hypothetical protein
MSPRTGSNLGCTDDSGVSAAWLWLPVSSILAAAGTEGLKKAHGATGMESSFTPVWGATGQGMRFLPQRALFRGEVSRRWGCNAGICGLRAARARYQVMNLFPCALKKDPLWVMDVVQIRGGQVNVFCL